jgi:hypothetical protein
MGSLLKWFILVLWEESMYGMFMGEKNIDLSMFSTGDSQHIFGWMIILFGVL